MRLNELVKDGDTRQHSTEKFYIRGQGKDSRATKLKSPFFGSSRVVTVSVHKKERIEVSVTVPDIVTGKELVVQVVGIGEIASARAQRAAQIHAAFGNLENGVAHFLRKGLSGLSDHGGLVTALVADGKAPKSIVTSILLSVCPKSS